MSGAVMTRDRFERLAEAYGGEVARWPAAAREPAAVFMAAEREAARQILAQAAGLDAALETWTLAAPSEALTARILAQAQAPAPLHRRTWLSPAALAAGLAAACAAGVIVGVQVSSRSAEAQEVAVTNTLSAISGYDLGEGA